MHKLNLLGVTALCLASSLLLLAQANPAQPTAGGNAAAAVQSNKPAGAPVGESAETATGQGNKLSETPFSNADVVKLSKLGLGDDVVIAKINQATRVNFQVETDDLIALKDAGVSQKVITAMVKRSSTPVMVQGGRTAGGIADTPLGAVAIPGMDDMLVRLVTQDGTTDLTSIGGHTSATWAYFTTLMYMDYPNLKAEVRIHDRKPYILVESRKSPYGRIFLVRCESNKDDNNRSVKMGKSGAFSVGGFGEPDSDSDWTVPVEVKAVQDGLWRMDPRKDLKPGEYGVWGPSGELYDFGVDK